MGNHTRLIKKILKTLRFFLNLSDKFFHNNGWEFITLKNEPYTTLFKLIKTIFIYAMLLIKNLFKDFKFDLNAVIFSWTYKFLKVFAKFKKLMGFSQKNTKKTNIFVLSHKLSYFYWYTQANANINKKNNHTNNTGAEDITDKDNVNLK